MLNTVLNTGWWLRSSGLNSGLGAIIPNPTENASTNLLTISGASR